MIFMKKIKQNIGLFHCVDRKTDWWGREDKTDDLQWSTLSQEKEVWSFPHFFTPAHSFMDFYSDFSINICRVNKWKSKWMIEEISYIIFNL